MPDSANNVAASKSSGYFFTTSRIASRYSSADFLRLGITGRHRVMKISQSGHECCPPGLARRQVFLRYRRRQQRHRQKRGEILHAMVLLKSSELGTVQSLALSR